MESIQARGDLSDYHLSDAARADLCRRLGKVPHAIACQAGAGAEVFGETSDRIGEINIFRRDVDLLLARSTNG